MKQNMNSGRPGVKLKNVMCSLLPSTAAVADLCHPFHRKEPLWP